MQTWTIEYDGGNTHSPNPPNSYCSMNTFYKGFEKHKTAQKDSLKHRKYLSIQPMIPSAVGKPVATSNRQEGKCSRGKSCHSI